MNAQQFAQVLDRLDNLVQAIPAQPQQQPQRRGLSVKLKYYTSCDPEEWLAFRERFEIEARLQGWNDNDAKSQLKASIDEPARSRIQHINPLQPNYTLQQMLDECSTYYVPETDVEHCRRKWRAARQKEGEDVGSWHARIMSLFRRANPQGDANADPNLISMFIEGLVDPILQDYVACANPQTMIAALANARRKEDSLNQILGKAKVKAEPGVHALTHAKRQEFYGASLPAAAATVAAQQRRQPTRNSVCYRCGRRGHFAKFCTQQPRFNTPTQQPQRRNRRRVRLLFRHPKGFFRPLFPRRGQKGRWRKVRIPRRRSFRRTPRGTQFRANTVYAVCDDEADDEYDEVCVLNDNQNDEDADEYYYLDMDETDDGFIAAFEEMQSELPDSEIDACSDPETENTEA